MSTDWNDNTRLPPTPFSAFSSSLAFSPPSNDQAARRRPGACEGCRGRKSRCDGAKPVCSTCKDRDISCVYRKHKKRGRPARSGQPTQVVRAPDVMSTTGQPDDIMFTTPKNTMSTTGQSDDTIFTTSKNHSNSSSISAGGPRTPLINPLWDLEPDSRHSPPWDFDSFEIGNLDVFAELGQTPHAFLDPQSDISEHTNDLRTKNRSQVQDQGEVTLASNMLTVASSSLPDSPPLSRSLFQTFRSIDFSTISLAFRLLDDRECCLGISAEAEKALRDLLHSDILNLDQRRTRKPQTGESEVTSDSKLLNTYLTASFNNAYLHTTFLESKVLGVMLLEVTTHSTTDKTKIALVYATLAAGYRLYWGGGVHKDLRKAIEGSSALFAIALDCSEAVSEAASVTAFQALLSMSIFAVQWEPSQASALLAKTVACAQYLKLNQSQSYTQLGLSSKEQFYLRRAFWLLYAIEKPHSMRFGYFSMLMDAAIDHGPDIPCSEDGGPDMVGILCGFARLSSQIVQHLYGQEGLSKPDEVLEHSVNHLHQLVNAWKQEVIRNEGSTTSLDTSSKDGVTHVLLHLQYHELMLMVHGRLIALNQSQSKSATKLESGRLFLSSACAILDLSSTIDPMATPLSLLLIRLQIIAFCIVAINVPTSFDSHKLVVYMCLACGSCARSSLTLEVPFEKVNAVSAAAQQSIGRFCSMKSREFT